MDDIECWEKGFQKENGFGEGGENLEDVDVVLTVAFVRSYLHVVG